MADGLFGNIYDAQLQQQLLDQKAAQSYGTGWEAMTRAAAGAGGMLGRGISRAFGGVTPMEAKQAKINQIQQEFADADYSDPATFSAIGNRFMQEGFGDLAMESFDFGKQLYSAETSRISALKPTAEQAKTERGIRLAKACQAGSQKACELYDLHTREMQADIASTEAEAFRQKWLGTRYQQEAEQGMVGAKVAGMQAQTEERRTKIKGMETDNLFSQLTLNDRVAQEEFKVRKLNEEVRQAAADAGITEQQMQGGYGKLQVEQLREEIRGKQLQAEKMTIENLIASATQGDTIAQAELETQRMMAQNSNIQMDTWLKESKRNYTQAEIDAGLPALNAERIQQEMAANEQAMRETDVDILVKQAELGNIQANHEIERRKVESIILKNNAETELKIQQAKAAGDPDLSTVLTEQNRLNNEYVKDIGDWRSRKADLQTVMQLIKNPSAISDIAMMTKYLKILDPQSVARESEVALVESARGYLETIAMLPEKAQEGRLLADGQIGNIIDAVKAIYRSQHLSAYEAQESVRQKVAIRNKTYGLNLDVRAIIPDHEIIKAEDIPDFGMDTPADTGQEQRFTIKKVK